MNTTTKVRERVIFIEYQDKRPFSVITRKPFAGYDGTIGTCMEYYDVEWCKRDECYYFHNSGSGSGGDREVVVYGNVGGTTRFWAAEGVKVKQGNEVKLTRLKRSPYQRKIEGCLNDDGGTSLFQEGRCEYCPTCDDHLPGDECDTLCAHCWFCGESGEWSKPGERCDWGCEECRENDRETRPEPPKVGMVMVAEGYGIAASPLARITRKLLRKYGHTPTSLAERMGWCTEGRKAIGLAIQGEVYQDGVCAKTIESVANVLGLTDDEWRELGEGFRIVQDDH